MPCQMLVAWLAAFVCLVVLMACKMLVAWVAAFVCLCWCFDKDKENGPPNMNSVDGVCVRSDDKNGGVGDVDRRYGGAGASKGGVRVIKYVREDDAPTIAML